MTEEEAKTKWCPLLGIASAAFHANREARSDAPKKCIGSGCMMWRENQSMQDVVLGNPAGGRKSIIKQMAPDGTGYCGLAGKL